MQPNIKKEIAERLSFEFNKRAESIRSIAQHYDLDEKILTAYIQCEREINIDEIKNICNKLNINPTRLLFSKNYPKVKLSYRNSAHNVQNFASSIEDIFLLINNALPKIKIAGFERNLSQSCTRDDVIIEASSYANKIRNDFESPIDFLNNFSIPTLPLKRPDVDFDAFLIRTSDKMLICINSSRVLQRINFSLAHEICHILFDKLINVPIDTFLPDFYWRENFLPEVIPEFFAYKFAEFYLIPIEQASALAAKWPRIDIKFSQDLVNKGRTTREVLANAIFDSLRFTQSRSASNEVQYISESEQFRRMDFEERRERYMGKSKNVRVSFQSVIGQLNPVHSGEDTKRLSEFLDESHSKFINFIESEGSLLSEEVHEYILRTINFAK